MLGSIVTIRSISDYYRKEKMKFLILIALLAAISSCREPEPTIYFGTANGIASDGEVDYKLIQCYCWKTADSLAIHITGGAFAGIFVDIVNKEQEHQTYLTYYSDVNKFNNKWELGVQVRNDSIKVTYDLAGDSVNILGSFNLQSEEVTFFKDGRIVNAQGTFNCKMARVN
jgi:hypothetical protein